MSYLIKGVERNMAKNKFSSWLLTVTFLLMAVLVACQSPTATTPQTPQPGTVEKIKVAIIGPMQVVIGNSAWQAATLTNETINKDGGIKAGGKTYQFDLVKIDTNEQVSIDDAVNAVTRAIQSEKCQFILGGTRTESILAVQEIAMDAKIIYIDTGSASDPQILKVKNNYNRYKYYFRTGMPVTTTLMGMSIADCCFVANKIKKDFGIDKPRVALLLDKAAYTTNWTPLAQRVFAKEGMEIVGTWMGGYAGTDMFSEATAIQTVTPHIIYNVQSGPGGTAFVNAYGKLKIPAALVGNTTEAQALKFWKTTTGECNYMATYDTIGRIKMTDATIPFYDEHVKRFGEKPGFSSPNMAAGLLALKAAIEKTGTLDSDALVPVLEKTDIPSLVGRLTFNEPGFPHQATTGPGARTLVSFQWIDNQLSWYFPNGTDWPKSLLDEGVLPGLKDVKYEGITDYKLPPWMIDYWKKK
jgi:branched-chain amino acid transport system substrate-binding protein